MWNKSIGILGGGQLGRMLLQSSLPLGTELSIMDAGGNTPCGAVARRYVEGDIRSTEDVVAFGSDKDIVTIEIESVDTKGLKHLEQKGVKVFPQPHIIELIQDKGKQKLFYQEHGIPTSPFVFADTEEEVLQALKTGPVVQKLCTGGYDGKGVSVLKGEEDSENILPGKSILEEVCPIIKELSVIVARNASGEIQTLDTVEMVFTPANLVDYLISPAEISDSVDAKAKELARNIAEKLEIVGLLAVEMFLMKDDVIWVNEVAPRPHNSGHQTIEGSTLSQYDLHLRAICNLPLPPVHSHGVSAMINIVGPENKTGKPVYVGLQDLMGFSGIFPHIYGKSETRPNRKLGHITLLGSTREECINKIEQVKSTLKITAQ